MEAMIRTKRRDFDRLLHHFIHNLFLVCVVMCAFAVPGVALGEPVMVRGLTEPYRTIDVAANESGVIAQIHVHEGQSVHKGDRLATLDCQLLSRLSSIAKQGMEAKGRLQAAQAEMRLKEQRAKNFAAAFEAGHARPEEVRRAETDLAVARAQVLAAEEDLTLKKLEFEKVKTQIELRTVRAPVDGVVTEIHKEAGEFVAPNDPTVLTLVQLDPLLAVFSMTIEEVDRLHIGQKVQLRLPENPDPVDAKIEFISPVANPESGTLLVKARIDNANREYRSGTRCMLELSPGSELPATSPTPTEKKNTIPESLPKGYMRKNGKRSTHFPLSIRSSSDE
ncbi:MAG: efflux RND transporter periplasmic adaptor subunit [Planctomycetia bacterium]